MTQRDEVQKFEQGRIKVLQEERLHIQKKTFTKWMNSFLQKARMEVEDLFVDLADGKKLLKLLEIISGEKLAKPNNGKMRVHKIENVNKSLDFLHTKVRLESIGAEDIVDGNKRLILGLIWTIILRFQIQEIEIDVDEENESSEKKSAKDALLLWVQRKTNGYPHVSVGDFSGSWRSGMAFNALIHAHRPDLFDYNQLQPNRHIDNLNHAFDIANNELGIPRLLDAEDVDTTRPDEKSVITYVASYYHTFARMKNEEKSGRRIAKIIKQMVDADKMKVEYETLTTKLLDWIRMKVVELEDRNFPNNLEGIQTLLLEFGYYRTQEKPPKYKERSEIEALFFNINTQLKELRQPAYVPPDGKLVQDIERAWEALESAEHSREVALRSELRRQERLEQLNYKFQKKSKLREGYLTEMIQILSDPKYGSNLAQVDATFKKHEAISADILAREERFNDLTEMCNELVRENYRNYPSVQAKESMILSKWKELLELLEKHKFNLNRMGNIINLIREIDTTLSSVNQLKGELSSLDTGVHLMAVEELLQRHALQELQVSSLGETEKKLKRLGEQIVAQSPKEEEILKKKLNELEVAYVHLKECSARRRAILEEARNFYQFLQDQEDEESWLIEKQRICQAGISAKDLRGVISLQQKHKLLLDEIKIRKNKFEQQSKVGQQLINDKHPRADEIHQHMENNKKEWKKLEELANERTKQLQDAAEAYQFYADANEADSWLNEKTSILSSSDYGSDEPSAQALLQRHKDLEGELNAYSGDIQSLNNQAKQLIAAGISHLDLTAKTEVPVQVEETVYETKMVPTEVWEDEVIEKVEQKEVVEERSLPQVKALYPFNDHGLNMIKGEVMILLNKSNPDWWCVRKSDGTDGFAPANYVVPIEPRIVHIPVKKPEKVKTVKKVKKVKLVPQKVPVKVMKPVVSKQKKIDESNTVPKRLKHINDTYSSLQEMAAKRHALLEDAIRLFRFYRECDDFEKWIKDKEKLLASDDPNENVEQAKRKYENFLTDLSASNKRIEALDAEVEEFEKQNLSQIDKVKARHRQVHAAWDHLNKLKARKERSLEGASSVELFQRTCDEAKDWMLEKMTQLDTAALGHDLKTVQALQRRHQHLERELAPLQEKVHKVEHLAKSVTSAYPHEKQNVVKREDEIKELWQRVKDKANDRRARLEDAVGQQIFTNSSNALLVWISDVKDQLNADTTVRDVATAQLLLKNHQDLKQNIKAHDDEFKQVIDLGKQLLKTNPELTSVADKIVRLEAEKEAISRGWREKDHWLQQCEQLQLFNKEADKIDAATSSHLAFLELTDLGNSYDEVEALIKQHQTLLNTLAAQDERVNGFNKKADLLIANKHYESEGINNRRNQVLERRQTAKHLANERSQALEASRCYQEFCAGVHELRSWLAEKLKIASDESYRDLSNLERKLQKHEAFEREIRANEGQLRTVNDLGQALIAQDSYRKGDVAKTLRDINEEWKKLVGISIDKGRRLRQALTQHNYNTAIDDVNNKLIEIETNLKNTNVGTDLRSCRDLYKKHEGVENELNQCCVRVDDLVNQSNEMTHDDHFDSDAVRKEALACQRKLKGLDTPMKKHRDALDEALRFYKFGFDLDNELQWIKEHLPLASSSILGQNLHQAQNLYKKHKKLEAEIIGHQPVIDKTLENGKILIEQKHPDHKKVEDLCDHLRSAWLDLNNKAKERTQKLDLSLKAQQFFFEASEVESWLNEKADILASKDYGRDRDAATKLLTKHKALELELDTYHGIITEMGRGAQALVQSGHPESKAIQERQNTLEHLVRSLQRKAVNRQQRLMESLFRHEYFLESGELEKWIAEMMQYAISEDYGQDYEHLLILQAKFDDFKHRFEAGSERFRQCEDLAQKLITNESPYIADIEHKQKQLVESWNVLQNEIKNREQKLKAAGEIHRFHRDVSDALSRIQEKDAALGTELGKDLNSALALYRRHEAFENELLVLNAQLQILVDDAANLQKLYPNNKIHLQKRQEVVVRAWQGLEERANLRKEKLQASVDLQKFLAQVRDLTSWATSLRIAMATEEHVRSTARAQALKAEHEALKVEIEAREESFRAAEEMATAMAQTGHHDAAAAVERCDALFEERERLHKAWHMKKIYLDQLIDLHCFLREAKQLENISNAQEASLGNTDFGDNVDEITRTMKKQEAFEKLINSQDERLDSLFQSGDKLISQNHFEKAQIASRLGEIQSKRLKVRQLCSQRRHQLDDALLYAEFVRDVADTKIWIVEKEKKLISEIKTGEVIANLEDKIKKLQKYQAFQAEITANEGRIYEICHKGDILISKGHKASPEIKKQLAELTDAWNKLKYEISLRGKGLEEAQDILEFNNFLEKLEAWMRDKEIMIQAGDTGRDYEHCQALQRKLDDVDSDMRVDDARIRSMNTLADKLIKQKQPGVKERRDAFIDKWHNLQGALERYRAKLAGALEIHLFDRDVDDTLHRIHEKTIAMDVEDLGKDLADVQALQRKQETLDREMSAVEKKLKDHEREAYILIQKYPNSAEHIQINLKELQDSWLNLLNVREKRRNDLANAYTRQKFFGDLKDLEIWVADSIKRMESRPKATSDADAEALLALHDELKVEIDNRQNSFKNLIDFAHNLGTDDPEILKAVDKLSDLQDSIQEAWMEHKNDLTHEYLVQGFNEQADQLDSWLASKEAFLNNDDIGDNLRAVETLIRKQQDFEVTLTQQLGRVTDLSKMGEEVLNNSRYDNKEIKARLDAILKRQEKLLKSSELRRKILEDSKRMHMFIRNLHETENWLIQKLQIANDDNYRDPSNLQTKIQKHIAFEAEVMANSPRIQGIINEGSELIKSDHFASKDIKSKIDVLEQDWNQLKEMSNLKKERLNDAYQALLFNRSLEEFEMWLSDVEQQIQSTDFGKDMATVNSLLKKHSALENDIQQHTENCESINETAEVFKKNDHFMSDEVLERAHSAILRFHQLHEPMQARRDQLEASFMLQQFTRDVEDELQWLVDREPIASSSDLGSTLTAVQSLQKKHQALETELLSREPIVAALLARAAHLKRAGHSAANVIDEQGKEVKNKLTYIRDLASVRKLRLQDSLEVQMYYAEADEALQWLQEKRPALISSEVGRDEESTQSLQRKLEALNCEVQAFEKTIEKLSTVAKSLIERQHYDADNVAVKQHEIENNFKAVQRLLSQRESKLSEALTYFGFIRECNEIQEWMTDQEAKAASEDYGTDVEHVELLTQAFETFLASLNNSEPRVQACIDSGTRLIQANSSYASSVEDRVKEIKNEWEDLKELANARQDALAGAKHIHIFDRTADETISWILEKQAILSIDYYETDLEGIQALVRKHEALETEILAVREQVESVVHEANRLISEFPDAEEHIEVKKEDTLAAWDDLQQKANERREKLQQSEHLQTYFDQYQDLLAWINEMYAKVTSPDLPQDVIGAELLLEKHKELKAEIEARSDIFDQFYSTGHNLIQNGHLFSTEIGEKIHILTSRMDELNRTWYDRSIIYEQNLDVQLFKHEANMLENWLDVREGTLKDGKVGDSIVQVEDLIRKHEDFEKTIMAQEDKFAALQRITMVEEEFIKQKEREAKARQAERERLEQEKLAQRKKLEMQRITELRRQEQYERPEEPVQTNERTNGVAPYSEPTENATSSSLTKSNSIAHMFADKIRRGQDINVKRAESMKVAPSKPPKRTPSFTTRRRGSLRKSPEVELPPVEIQSFLERKQVLSAGYKRASNRAWKTVYAVLCGQLLCFFKDREHFALSKALCSPIGIHNADCTVADDYNKKKHTFRLINADRSEYLFACSSNEEMQDWVKKISFRAKLPPSQQLLNLEIPKDSHELDQSSQSSRTSSPDVSDSVVLRHDIHYHNGNNQTHGHRHTLSGECPPPLPMSEPPQNYQMGRHVNLSSSRDAYGNEVGYVRADWSSNSSLPRPSSMQPPPADHKKSSRIMDLFRKKRHTSQM